MPKWFTEWARPVAVGVGIALTIPLLLAAIAAWPHLWAWLKSGEGEVVHRTVFLLTVLMLYFWRVLPLMMWTPVRATPIAEQSIIALKVLNLGRSGSFFANSSVMCLRKTVGPFQRLVDLEPTWASNDLQPGTVAAIPKNQSRILNLARARRSEQAPRSFDVFLFDAGQIAANFHYEASVGIEIDLQVMIMRREPRWRDRILPHPRASVTRVTVRGDESGVLSVHRYRTT